MTGINDLSVLGKLGRNKYSNILLDFRAVIMNLMVLIVIGLFPFIYSSTKHLFLSSAVVMASETSSVYCYLV